MNRAITRSSDTIPVNPLFALCYRHWSRRSWRASSAGERDGFLFALAALVLLSGSVSMVTSYVLASLVVRVLPKRTVRMS